MIETAKIMKNKNNNELIKIEYLQKNLNVLVRVTSTLNDVQATKDVMPHKERFIIFDSQGKNIGFATTILREYLSIIVPHPGRYAILREATNEIKWIDIDSMIYESSELPEITFTDSYNQHNLLIHS